MSTAPNIYMQNYHYYVYILTCARNSVFYAGITNDLVRRVYEHKMGLVEGFTKKHNIKTLRAVAIKEMSTAPKVYYEQFEDLDLAIAREKSIKKWKRQYKINAIESMNPEWKDLYIELLVENSC